MSYIRDLLPSSPVWLSLYDCAIRLANIFRLHFLRINFLLILALIYFLIRPHLLSPNVNRIPPEAVKVINKNLFGESYYVIFSVYTYHSAIRVNKSLVSIVYSSTRGRFPFQCLAQNDSGWRRVAQAENYDAEVKHGLCETMAYVARCYLPPAQTYMLLGTTGAFELKVQSAYEKREALVVCTAPSYLFELWMTALVSIESARYFGATLRVVYIQSIISDLYKILQAYEREGIILIKDGFDMPKLEDHPKIDSAHHNQAVIINDCLYQFKDAADFIVISDWDDIFLTGFESKLGVGAIGPAYNKGYSMVDFLIDQRQNDSTIGAFILEWMKTERSDLFENKQFSICSTIMSETAKVSTLVKEGKYAMIPAAVKTAWVHYPLEMEEIYVQKKYDENDGIIVYHLNKPRWTSTTLEENTDECKDFLLDQNLRSLIRKYGIEKEFLRLPHHPVHFLTYQTCFNYGTHAIRAEQKYFCPSYTPCKLTPQNETTYIISNAKFIDHLDTISNQRHVFTYVGAMFTESSSGQREAFKQKIHTEDVTFIQTSAKSREK